MAYAAGPERPHSTGKYPTDTTLFFEAFPYLAAVEIFRAADLSHDPQPIATFQTHAGCPGALAMDSGGTLYVAGSCFSYDVEEYAKGSTKLQTTITDGISNPQALAIDNNNNLYVLNHPAQVTVYAPGATTPSVTFSGGGMKLPTAMAFDRTFNLYIADFEAGAVFEVKAGYFTVRKLALKGLVEPTGVAVDPQTGYLWVADAQANTIDVFDLSRSKSPIKTLPGNGDPGEVIASWNGPMTGAMLENDLDTEDAYLYKPGRYEQHLAIHNTALVGGMLIRKP